MSNKPDPTDDDLRKAGFIIGQQATIWTLHRAGLLHACSYHRDNVETVARKMWRELVRDGEISV